MTGVEVSGSRPAADLAASASAEVLAELGRLSGPGGVVVDSPPGAGKSTLVVRAAIQLASAGERVMVVAQTNGQVDDLVDRLAVAAPSLLIGRLSGASYVPAPQVVRHIPRVVVARWTGLAWDPMLSAVAVLLRNNPEVPVLRLPVSWRLPESAVGVVGAAFYPFSGFVSGAGERSSVFSARALRAGPADEALDLAASSGWAFYELPGRHTIRTDGEAVAACAELAARAVRRGMVCYSSEGPSEGLAARVAVGTAHRDQAQAVRAALGELGVSVVVVDTANRLQGREYDLVIVLHPLSGRRDASAFHLEAGRLCVLCSRHRQACVVVARVGIPELLDAHPYTEPVHLGYRPSSLMGGQLTRQCSRTCRSTGCGGEAVGRISPY